MTSVKFDLSARQSRRQLSTTASGPKLTFVVWPALVLCARRDVARGGKGPRGQRAALHCGGRALNAPAALRCAVLRPHRQTRCVRCALCARTVAMRMMTNALRAGRKPCAPQRHRGALHAVPTDLCRRASGMRAVGARNPAPAPDPGATHTKSPASRQAGPGAGDLWGAEERSGRGGARSALGQHSHRACPNEEPAGRVVSCAMRPAREHRRAVCASSARPPHHERAPGPACREARQREAIGDQEPMSATGRKRTLQQPARSIGRERDATQWSN